MVSFQLAADNLPIHRSPHTPPVKQGKHPEMGLKNDYFSGNVIDLLERSKGGGGGGVKWETGREASWDEKKGYEEVHTKE